MRDEILNEDKKKEKLKKLLIKISKDLRVCNHEKEIENFLKKGNNN